MRAPPPDTTTSLTLRDEPPEGIGDAFGGESHGGRDNVLGAGAAARATHRDEALHVGTREQLTARALRRRRREIRLAEKLTHHRHARAPLPRERAVDIVRKLGHEHACHAIDHTNTGSVANRATRRVHQREGRW